MAGRRVRPIGASTFPGAMAMAPAGVATGSRHHQEHQNIFGSGSDIRARGHAGVGAASPGGSAAPPQPTPKVFTGTGSALKAQPGMDVGVCHDQGRRPSMEDAHILMTKLRGGPPGTSFFCVADGHSGRVVADMVAELLPAAVASRLTEGASPPVALTEAFVSVDRDVYKRLKGRDGGAACVAGLLCGATLWVAWLGDCRAVVSERGKAIGMTTDHRPADLSEVRRVEAAG
eukprot:Hpha_TRINITY_DN16309_c0_g4::TRINITY_DN16309_c0_g4_i1::g.57753::m.57753